MYQRAVGGAPLPWEWNSSTNTDPLLLFPHAGETANAYYSRTEKALKFFYFRRMPFMPNDFQLVAINPRGHTSKVISCRLICY